MRSDDVNRINAQTQVIAVWMPDTNVVGEQSWANYRVSVDELEGQTSYDLLSKLEPAVQRATEAKADALVIQ